MVVAVVACSAYVREWAIKIYEAHSLPPSGALVRAVLLEDGNPCNPHRWPLLCWGSFGAIQVAIPTSGACCTRCLALKAAYPTRDLGVNSWSILGPFQQPFRYNI